MPAVLGSTLQRVIAFCPPRTIAEVFESTKSGYELLIEFNSETNCQTFERLVLDSARPPGARVTGCWLAGPVEGRWAGVWTGRAAGRLDGRGQSGGRVWLAAPSPQRWQPQPTKHVSAARWARASAWHPLPWELWSGGGELPQRCELLGTSRPPSSLPPLHRPIAPTAPSSHRSRRSNVPIAPQRSIAPNAPSLPPLHRPIAPTAPSSHRHRHGPAPPLVWLFLPVGARARRVHSAPVSRPEPRRQARR